MKRIDFENGTITGNILGAALPMLIAQILNLLYNIVDRIYIARIPEIGTCLLYTSHTSVYSAPNAVRQNACSRTKSASNAIMIG